MMSTVILALAIFSPLADDDAKTFEGKWAFTAMQMNGQKAPAAALEGVFLVVDGDKYKQTQGGMVVEEGTSKLFPDKKPKEIDLKITDGPQKGKTQLGIYKFEGDVATFCFSDADVKTRPKDFTAGEGSNEMLFVMKKVK